MNGTFHFSQALVTLFSVVDPVAGAALFAALTAGESHADKVRMARRAALATGFVLLLFQYFGVWVFALFSITLNAFQVAGGLVVGIMGLDLLKATDTGVRSTEEERRAGLIKADVSITPLAIPMLAGPGAISTVMILAGRGSGIQQQLSLSLVIVVVAGAVWLLLAAADRVTPFLGPGGRNILSRLMGIIVLAIAVQFMADGILALVGRANPLP